MSTHQFHPLVQQWFHDRFRAPTESQRLGWPSIAAHQNTLIAAPTGSGKTLAAFLICLDRLFRQWIEGRLNDGVQVVYVSPLRALSNDIHRNLEIPLRELRQLAAEHGFDDMPIRAAVRTGDTPSSQRQAMLRKPPHILVTTPESLFNILTSAKSRGVLRTVDTIIVDEIHALARDKRGSHLALTLERLTCLCTTPPVRIGLSATQKPIEQIAQFLVGTNRDCNVIDVGHIRGLDLAVSVPPSELSAVCSHEQWAEVYAQLTELIQTHRSTLVFVNTRRMAERIALRLTESLGEEAVASHHGSLARPIRLSAERRLKDGKLKAIVATASLEMGIDIGYVDLVCQIGSPRSIATFLQRVGRSGHSLGATPRGRIFPMTRDELIESMALIRSVHKRQLDCIEIPIGPLDILAQQIVAAVACDQWNEADLIEMFRNAWSFRDVKQEDYQALLEMLANGIARNSRRGAYLHRDQINGILRARKGARLAAITSGGAIPETAEYRVITEDEGTLVGTVDEDFAVESTAGDIFVLGTSSWRVRYVRGGDVVVHDAQGAPPSVPFWFGEGLGRTIELSNEISLLRREIAEKTIESDFAKSNDLATDGADQAEVADVGREQAMPPAPRPLGDSIEKNPAFRDPSLAAWLRTECGVDQWGADQAVRYIAAQSAALGVVPNDRQIVYERFFDESGGMQLVIHAPLGQRVNRAWGLAMRKRFCRSFDFELQAAATDDGILLSMSPQHSFPIPDLFKMLGPHNARYLLEQALLAVPMFQVRWRWNVTRALAVLRRQSGQKVPPHLQRFRSDDLLAAVFPETVGCLENHHGDVEVPDHPLVRQTMFDCLHEAMDLDRWIDTLEKIKAGEIKLISRDTREPSPFCHEIINANPYAFLDDAPLEERRTRAVSTRRSLSVDDCRDLAKLDPAAIEQIRREAWPLARDLEELHDALLSLVIAFDEETTEWRAALKKLVAAGRAARVRLPPRDGSRATCCWIAAERWPIIAAVYPDAVCQPPVQLPESLREPVAGSDGLIEVVQGRLQHSGPIAAEALAESLQVNLPSVNASLEALEGRGVVLRGSFTGESQSDANAGSAETTEWCERRLLARIHRLTLHGLRKRIQPVAPTDFMRFLVQRHRIGDGQKWNGPMGVREAVAQLQGFEMPAGAWENDVLARRVDAYENQWLDQLFMSGEAMWGRLRPPRRDDRNGRRMTAMTRTMPITLLLRENLRWLLPTDRVDVSAFASSNAAQVMEVLSSRGALFSPELKMVTGQLPSHLEDALRELSALGLITSDSFSAVRRIVADRRSFKSRRRRRLPSSAAPAGRWSRFPGLVEPVERAESVEKWCRLLLQRYGVMFRDLLAREYAAPSWWELVSCYRRMELRGEIRGGRFVSGVAGEQFAYESAVEQLRAAREQPEAKKWVVISAADPLNLHGIITKAARIPATHRNALLLLDGRFVAAKEAQQVDFFEDFDVAAKADMKRALLTGGGDRFDKLRTRYGEVARP